MPAGDPLHIISSCKPLSRIIISETSLLDAINPVNSDCHKTILVYYQLNYYINFFIFIINNFII